ncbi:MAG: hypothetical protein K8R88_05595, partial [Armatimonadetes bacterium]|nr:hypothetical protein [Armatimonadota bacterium]
DSVEVTPSSNTWNQNESRQFAASAKTNAGAYVFVDPTSFTWSVLGTVASVNSSGIALGVNPGTGAVRATHTPSGVTGSAPITITAFTPTRTKWTVLVYLNAANDLYSFSDLNVNQMESITSADVRFVLQWKQSRSIFPSSSFDGTRRYLVKPDQSASQINSQLVQDMGEGVDMGSAQTLKEFIEWGQAAYPSDRTCLVIWNHGSGWNRGTDATRAVSYDDELGTTIQTWELKNALLGKHFDILSWDASLMQMAEVMFEVKDYADYVAGSEESPPGEGLPYHLVFAPFVQAPTATTRALSKGFVDGMTGYSPYATRKITQSVVETAKLSALATATLDYKNLLITNATVMNPIITAVRGTAQSYSPSTTRYYRDFRDVIAQVNQNASTPLDVIASGNLLDTALSNAIAWEGHNSNSAGSKGIAIDLTPSSRFATYASDYNRLAWNQASGWGSFLLQSP